MLRTCLFRPEGRECPGDEDESKTGDPKVAC